MNSKSMLEILQVFLVVLGVLGVIWGIYDMFGEGQQSSVGVKKLVGGLAFAAISWFLMSWAISKVGTAESEAGIKGAFNLPFITSYTSYIFHSLI